MLTNFLVKLALLHGLGPQTNDAIKGYGRLNKKNIALVPIAFTSDHIETLFELDEEYIEEARKAGMTGVKRVDSLNASPTFINALSSLVKKHLDDQPGLTQQLQLRCPSCVSSKCVAMREWAQSQINS